MTEASKADDAAKQQQQNEVASSSRPSKRKTRKELKEEVQALQMKEPESLWDMLKFPLVLAIVFGISLLVFHHAPHEKSKHKGFKLPKPKVNPNDMEMPPKPAAVDENNGEL
mmetsp:Transcript_22900/g.64885  ORF Transcript_22900/g.64885 Transcript_22900/m.64885 type:complete len:112 (-) Transcript_22900:268-603(-)